jgi:hypothetical protein
MGLAPVRQLRVLPITPSGSQCVKLECTPSTPFKPYQKNTNPHDFGYQPDGMTKSLFPGLYFILDKYD